MIFKSICRPRVSFLRSLQNQVRHKQCPAVESNKERGDQWKSTRADYSSIAKRFETGAVRVLLLGPPGVGKGTFGKLMAPILKAPVISSGDMLRSEIRKATPLGLSVQQIMENGGLVSDELITEVVLSALSGLEGKGFILDGFPRTIAQANTLQKKQPLDAAIVFELPDEILLEKSQARVECVQCNGLFNTADIRRDGFDMPPLMPPKTCGPFLEHRVDDTPDVILNRLKVYHDQTSPLIGFYDSLKILSHWSVVRGVQDFPEVIKMLERDLLARGWGQKLN